MEKAEVQRYLATYIGRREETHKKYTDIISNQSKKIKAYRKTLKRIEAKEQRVDDLGKKVYEFTDCKFWEYQIPGPKNVQLAKALFYKAGLESKMTPTDLVRYCGNINNTIPYRTRENFTKSFTIKPENLSLWQKFKKFLKE